MLSPASMIMGCPPGTMRLAPGTTLPALPVLDAVGKITRLQLPDAKVIEVRSPVELMVAIELPAMASRLSDVAKLMLGALAKFCAPVKLFDPRPAPPEGARLSARFAGVPAPWMDVTLTTNAPVAEL